MNYQDLLKKTEIHVIGFYKDHSDVNLFYHNQSHASKIFERAKKIAAHYYLDEHTTFIVCAAACFIDCRSPDQKRKITQSGKRKTGTCFLCHFSFK